MPRIVNLGRFRARAAAAHMALTCHSHAHGRYQIRQTSAHVGPSLTDAAKRFTFLFFACTAEVCSASCPNLADLGSSLTRNRVANIGAISDKMGRCASNCCTSAPNLGNIASPLRTWMPGNHCWRSCLSILGGLFFSSRPVACDLGRNMAGAFPAHCSGHPARARQACFSVFLPFWDGRLAHSDFGMFCPNSAESGQNLFMSDHVCQMWPDSGRSWPNAAKLGQARPKCGPSPTKLGRCRPMCMQSWVNLGQLRQTFGLRHSRKSCDAAFYPPLFACEVHVPEQGAAI